MEKYNTLITIWSIMNDFCFIVPVLHFLLSQFIVLGFNFPLIVRDRSRWDSDSFSLPANSTSGAFEKQALWILHKTTKVPQKISQETRQQIIHKKGEEGLLCTHHLLGKKGCSHILKDEQDIPPEICTVTTTMLVQEKPVRYFAVPQNIWPARKEGVCWKDMKSHRSEAGRKNLLHTRIFCCQSWKPPGAKCSVRVMDKNLLAAPPVSPRDLSPSAWPDAQRSCGKQVRRSCDTGWHKHLNGVTTARNQIIQKGVGLTGNFLCLRIISCFQWWELVNIFMSTPLSISHLKAINIIKFNTSEKSGVDLEQMMNWINAIYLQQSNQNF